MLMRPLLLTSENKDKATRVLVFAEKTENWYHHPGSPWVPGDHPEFVAIIDTYRCVYTHTVYRGTHYRHLSISVPARGWFPNEVAVYTLATFFGFTGAKKDNDVAVEPGDDWMLDLNEIEQCILIFQEFPQERVDPPTDG